MTKEYALTQSNVWKVLGQNGLEDATQQEADKNQVILEATLKKENLTFSEVSISEVRFTYDDKQVRGIINCMKDAEFLQIRI